MLNIIPLSIEVLLAVGLPVLIATTALVWVGLRGRHAWASPYCRKCKFDLRGRVPEETPTCPECGFDLKRKRAIGYVRHRPRWSLLGLGVLVFMSPGFVVSGIYTFERIQQSAVALTAVPPPVTAMDASELPSQPGDVVVQWIAGNIDAPEGWSELESRLYKGTLASADAIAALDLLIDDLAKTSEGQSYIYLYKQRGFLGQVAQAGMIDDERLRALIHACYGESPHIEVERIAEHSATSSLTIRYGAFRGLEDSLGLPYRLIWSLHPIKHGDETVGTQMGFRHGNYAKLDLWTPQLPVGVNELDVRVEVGLFDAADLVGYDEQSARIEDWPKARLRWTQSVPLEVVVYGYGDTPVVTTTDPGLKPEPSTFRVDQAVARYQSGQRRSYVLDDGRYHGGQVRKVFLKLRAVGVFEVPLSMDAYLHIGDQTVSLGELTYSDTADYKAEWELEGNARDIKDWDVPGRLVLVPNPKHLYSDPAVHQCWGERITIEGIEVRSLLDEEAGRPAADDQALDP